MAQWYKKDILQGPRNYIFSCDSREELFTWLITLNFLKMKALYDEFSVNFGVVTLPLFLIEKEEIKNIRNLKKKFNKNSYEDSRRQSETDISLLYNSMVRKSVMNKQNKTSFDLNKNNSYLIRRISNLNFQKMESVDAEEESFNRQMCLKHHFNMLIIFGFINFFSYTEDIIFNLDNIGQIGYIHIPDHISCYHDLPTEENDPYVQSILKKQLKKDGKLSIYSNLDEIREESIDDGRKLSINSKTSGKLDLSHFTEKEDKENNFYLTDNNESSSFNQMANANNDFQKKKNSILKAQNNYESDNDENCLSQSKNIFDQDFDLNIGIRDLDKLIEFNKKK